MMGEMFRSIDGKACLQDLKNFKANICRGLRRFIGVNEFGWVQKRLKARP